MRLPSKTPTTRHESSQTAIGCSPSAHGPKINDSKDPFARYPDLQEEKAIIHDKKVESYVLMAPGKVDVAACVEINLHAIDEQHRVDGVGRPKFGFHTGREGRGRFTLIK